MRDPATALANWFRTVKPGGHLIVTVPDEDLLARLSGLADRVELVRWDLRDALDPELAARVSMVVIGHYWTTPDRYTRLHDLPNLRYEIGRAHV